MTVQTNKLVGIGVPDYVIRHFGSYDYKPCSCKNNDCGAKIELSKLVKLKYGGRDKESLQLVRVESSIPQCLLDEVNKIDFGKVSAKDEIRFEIITDKIINKYFREK